MTAETIEIGGIMSYGRKPMSLTTTMLELDAHGLVAHMNNIKEVKNVKRQEENDQVAHR